MNYKQHIWESYHYRFGLAGEGQADVIQTHLDNTPGVVLNVGSGGDGRRLDALARHCTALVAADRSMGLVAMARDATRASNTTVIRADAYALPLGDASADYVLALGLFYAIERPGDVMTEFARVCRPAGLVMITNAVVHCRHRLEDAAAGAGLALVEHHEGHCYAASGEVKRRYMLVFRPATNNLPVRV